jgi:hypothetical protein
MGERETRRGKEAARAKRETLAIALIGIKKVATQIGTY